MPFGAGPFLRRREVCRASTPGWTTLPNPPSRPPGRPGSELPGTLGGRFPNAASATRCTVSPTAPSRWRQRPPLRWRSAEPSGKSRREPIAAQAPARSHWDVAAGVTMPKVRPSGWDTYRGLVAASVPAAVMVSTYTLASTCFSRGGATRLPLSVASARLIRRDPRNRPAAKAGGGGTRRRLAGCGGLTGLRRSRPHRATAKERLKARLFGIAHPAVPYQDNPETSRCLGTAQKLPALEAYSPDHDPSRVTPLDTRMGCLSQINRESLREPGSKTHL